MTGNEFNKSESRRKKVKSSMPDLLDCILFAEGSDEKGKVMKAYFPPNLPEKEEFLVDHMISYGVLLFILNCY
jgi:hypothetical protein